MNVHEKIQELIGDNAVLLYGMIVWAYLDENGQERVGYIAIEDPGVQQVLGMLVMAEHNIANQGIATA